jgi:hypothetical protein
MPEMGEYAAGAWLRLKADCEIVVYDQELNPTGREMNEVDVIGLDLEHRKAYFCEVATHLKGVNYGKGNKDSAERIEKKFDAASKYSRIAFPGWDIRFMFWAPYVPEGILTNLLEDFKQRFQVKGISIELIINKIYTKQINDLQELARSDAREKGEPFYRVLQILGHLR